MKKIMVVFGTRPEAIKMCPLVVELKSRRNFDTVVCVTGQHREMLSQVLDVFGVVPDHDLAVMRDGQTLFELTKNILDRMKGLLEVERPDLVLVQGDTTTAFAAALACFYLNIPVGHVEAGLRTYNIHAPYPEEFNRQAVGIISRYHFAPTERCRENLIREGKPESSIFVTGNTVIDAMRTTVRPEYRHPELDWASDSRLIILTAHRRENFGEPMRRIFRAVRRILNEYKDVKVIYPVHLNPEVRRVAEELSGCERLHMIEPLDVLDFHNFMARCYMIMTDSGGVQEEAPALGKPVLVMRQTTERPEGAEAGVLRLVGTDTKTIFKNAAGLLESQEEYEQMARACSLYGDGFASRRIADILEMQ
ncbi:MAG: non-hydrolyzing UDP-N-acetylglucosamine 2-epimerase [Eubacteriales bacterium]